MIYDNLFFNSMHFFLEQRTQIILPKLQYLNLNQNNIMLRLKKFACRFSSQKSQLSKLSGFQLKQSFYSQDYKTEFNRLEHKSTGCAIYHFGNNDINNAFASMARTIPKNDKGCPHILQHIACCGSQKFPVRDPFFTMLRRSVNTYMNAWTGEDFTCYPFSSANPKDWYNLYYVYLDMAMRPLLNQLDFRQEGWRYEINEEGVKQLKGIVLNEMLGAYQSSERQLIISLSKNLLGNTSYSYDSGGKPSQIVKLSYEELKQMHSFYYHPSNMGFYYYGDSSINQKLLYLQENYLNQYKREAHSFHNILKPTVIKKYEQIQSRNAETTSMIIGYYLKNMEQFDPIELSCLRILNYILLNTNQAEFYRVFIQSGLAETIGDSGLNFGKLSVFSLTLKGISNDFQSSQFKNLIEQTLLKLSKEGIPEKRLEQYKNLLQMDILLPKKNNGLRYLEGLLPYFNHRVSFTSLLEPRKTLRAALQKIKDKQYLQELINKYFLQNDNYSIIKQVPTPQDTPQQAQQNYESLQMPTEKIKEQQQKLLQRQAKKQNLDLLPSLKIEDLIELPTKKKCIVQTFENLRTYKKYTHHHIQIDEDIFYYRIVFNIKQVKESFLNKIDLFNYAINKGISAGKYNYKEFASLINNYTSNFSFKVDLAHDQSLNLVITAACLKQNKGKLFQLLDMLILSPKFQKDNLDRIFKAYQNQIVQSLTEQPMGQCLDLCGSFLTKKGYLSSNFKKHLGSLQIVQNPFQDGIFDDLLEDITNANQIEIIEHSNFQTQDLPLFLKTLVDKKSSPPTHPPAFQTKESSIAVTRDYHINFCSQQYLGPRFLSQDHAFLNLALQIMEQKYLHPQIRQKGGAYGARAILRNNDLIALYSYMDPNPERTFEVFKESIDNFLSQKDITEKDLFEAKITIIGKIDEPVTPQSEHVNSILKKFSQADLKRYKEKIKAATLQNILESVNKYMKDKKCSRVLFGNKIPSEFEEKKLVFPGEK